MGRVVGRIIRGWYTCTACGITTGSGGRVMGYWAPGSASELRSGSVGVWVAMVGRHGPYVDARIMRDACVNIYRNVWARKRSPGLPVVRVVNTVLAIGIAGTCPGGLVSGERH
jgi:hypothetical protein